MTMQLPQPKNIDPLVITKDYSDFEEFKDDPDFIERVEVKFVPIHDGGGQYDVVLAVEGQDELLFSEEDCHRIAAWFAVYVTI